ncbi:MAG: DUF938 domain-containing protein [Bradymonadia bacterium]
MPVGTLERRFSPAADRNKEVIFDVLSGLLPSEGLLLEVASGSGQHAAHMAPLLPRWRWQPTDIGPQALESISAWTQDIENVLEPQLLDVTEQPWPVETADALFCANMIHIAPWAATEGIFTGAGNALSAEAVVCLYGPFRFSGQFTAESNARFDVSLKSRDPRWGVRDIDDVCALAESNGWRLSETHAMPANNHVMVFRRL